MGSFEGWSLKTWARKNKDNFKAIVLLLAGYNYFIGFNWQSLVVALVAIGGKIAIDTLDYWLTDNPGE